MDSRARVSSKTAGPLFGLLALLRSVIAAMRSVVGPGAASPGPATEGHDFRGEDVPSGLAEKAGAKCAPACRSVVAGSGAELRVASASVPSTSVSGSRSDVDPRSGRDAVLEATQRVRSGGRRGDSRGGARGSHPTSSDIDPESFHLPRTHRRRTSSVGARPARCEVAPATQLYTLPADLRAELSVDRFAAPADVPNRPRRGVLAAGLVAPVAVALFGFGAASNAQAAECVDASCSEVDPSTAVAPGDVPILPVDPAVLSNPVALQGELGDVPDEALGDDPLSQTIRESQTPEAPFDDPATVDIESTVDVDEVAMAPPITPDQQLALDEGQHRVDETLAADPSLLGQAPDGVSREDQQAAYDKVNSDLGHDPVELPPEVPLTPSSTHAPPLEAPESVATPEELRGVDDRSVRQGGPPLRPCYELTALGGEPRCDASVPDPSPVVPRERAPQYLPLRPNTPRWKWDDAPCQDGFANGACSLEEPDPDRPNGQVNPRTGEPYEDETRPDVGPGPDINFFQCYGGSPWGERICVPNAPNLDPHGPFSDSIPCAQLASDGDGLCEGYLPGPRTGQPDGGGPLPPEAESPWKPQRELEPIPGPKAESGDRDDDLATIPLPRVVPDEPAPLDDGSLSTDEPPIHLGPGDTLSEDPGLGGVWDWLVGEATAASSSPPVNNTAHATQVVADEVPPPPGLVELSEDPGADWIGDFWDWLTLREVPGHAGKPGSGGRIEGRCERRDLSTGEVSPCEPPDPDGRGEGDPGPGEDEREAPVVPAPAPGVLA